MQKNKIAVDTFVDDISTVEKWISMGVQCISFTADTGIPRQTSKNIIDNLKSSFN